ncbi:MAG TPA: site-2 protease family protein [Chloroflexota bacterium]|jgi:Zn-dependent protease|nr:site-2 protease family protein [Chloroflexota bacterium]
MMFGRSRLTPAQILVLIGVAILFLYVSGGSLLLGLVRRPEVFVGLVLGLLVGITVHEAAHAATAVALGDPTPARMGRVSLNPLRHLDPLGTMFMLIASFGWGKPVVYNPANLRGNPRLGSALVAVMGPLSNIVVATLAAILLVSGPVFSDQGARILQMVMFTNVGLAAFNLLPIPPLDGFGFVLNLLPRPLAATIAPLAPYGPLLLLALVFIPGLGLHAILAPIQGVILEVVIGTARLFS